MERTLVRDLAGSEGRTAKLCGWAGAALGAPGLLTLRDHTGTADLVEDGSPRAAVVVESAIEATGTVLAVGPGSARPGLALERLRVLGPASTPLPVDGSSPLDLRLDWRYLDLRRPRNRLFVEVQTTAERAMRDWWHDNGFLELHSPKLRAVPNFSGRELFTVDYFGRPAYLAQSPQFYKQMAMAAGLDRVFEIAPVFRANPLLTYRHDTEFTSIDAEVSWIESHEDVMAMEEQWLRHVLACVEREHGPEVERHFGRPVRAPDVPFPRLTMAEAQRVLAGTGHQSSAPEGDIDAAGERALCEYVAVSTGHEFVFVTEYPEAVRPFYHMRVNEGSALTRSFDLLWNGLEVTTGAQREHRHDRLLAQAARNPARAEAVRPYLDFFRFGCPPHGGFGLGLTRMLMCILGLDDVRETTYLPRDRHRLLP